MEDRKIAQRKQNAISPTMSEDYAEWYQQVIRAAELADNSPVRGCMVIRPWGYALWENMQRVLDDMFKKSGHVNAYFPLFIPMSFLEKEAQHVQGFAKECAVVTHHRLEVGPDGKLVPAGELEEPLIVRPTSETIIGAMFAKWVQSYRDLPLLINQWANVVRWEMRPRLFLRTAEFLWQEGHTAHATEAEARQETMRMLDVYADFAENWMALPVIKGIKTPSERFPGAVDTFCIEAMMQDRKALQAGTSHYLGQNFARASGISFLNVNGIEEYAYTTSWGVSTRLIGALIMAHGDDNGLILPPRLAPAQVVVLPVIHGDAHAASVMDYCHSLVVELRSLCYGGLPLRVEFDTREGRGGDKVWSWIKKGVPLWVEAGPRDIASNSVVVARRDKPRSEKITMTRSQFTGYVCSLLDEIQANMLERARKFMSDNTRRIETRKELYEFFTPRNQQRPEIHGGFALCHWSGDPSVEEILREELGVTIRCIPLDAEPEQGTCPITGKPSRQRVVMAKAY